MLFVLTLNEDCDVSFFPFQERSTLDSGVVSYLNTPLPLVIIQTIIESLSKRHFLDHWYPKKTPEGTKKQILKRLKSILGDSVNLYWKGVNKIPACAEEGQFNSLIQKSACYDFNQIVRGKQLSTGDLRRFAKDLGLTEGEITKFAHHNVQQGWAEWVPSVKKIKGTWQCQRCGEKDVEEWAGYYGAAVTCRGCDSMGASTSLNVLYRDKRFLLNRPARVLFQPHWNLTEAQHQASEQVAEFTKSSSKEALLWAACGAGKTEVCFPSAAWALNQGKSVLFAAPRQDVIHDIAPRLQRDFPNYPIQVLTGMISDKLQAGGMVLATTHQVLRFWRAFDLIFMDEMDAFPYHGSRALEWGLRQALRQEGKLLYLTATPTPKSLKAVQDGQMQLIQLPARHHRNPLPVPIWVKAGKSLEAPAGRMGLWTEQIEVLREQGPVLVFVPKISWIVPWIKGFEQRYPSWRINGSYSADPERSKKLKDLQQGYYDVFVSTTILERGITLPRVQVIVLGADHPIFDERALVQMAGRVGRTSESPMGGVVLIAEKRTKAMRRAVQWIEEQNGQALELGLIKPKEKEGKRLDGVVERNG